MIRFNDRDAGQHIAELSGIVLGPADVPISRHKPDGTFMGGVILTCYTGAAFFMHQGARDSRWLNRDMLWAIFHYPFVQCGCTSIIGMTPSYNVGALSIALKAGFELETTIKDCLPGGENLIVTRMWRDKCRWLDWTPRTLVCNQSVQEGRI